MAAAAHAVGEAFLKQSSGSREAGGLGPASSDTGAVETTRAHRRHVLEQQSTTATTIDTTTSSTNVEKILSTSEQQHQQQQAASRGDAASAMVLVQQGSETGSSSTSPNKHGGGAGQQRLPAAMEIYLRITESVGGGAGDLSETDSSSRSGVDLRAAAAEHSTAAVAAAAGAAADAKQQQQHSPRHQQHEVDASVSTASGSDLDDAQKNGDSKHEEVEEEELGGVAVAAEEVPSPQRGEIPRALRRQGAMSDLWQPQGAFRSNQMSMKNMFEEVRERGTEWRGGESVFVMSIVAKAGLFDNGESCCLLLLWYDSW